MRDQPAHSQLGPSTLLRRALCPGSYHQEAGKPDTENKYGARGSALHGLMHSYITNALTEPQVLEAAGEDHCAAAMCIEEVSRLRRDFPHAHLWSERRINLESIHPAVGFGTADVVVAETWRRGAVVDFKFTNEDPPPARFNLQLAAEAVGLQREFDLEKVTVLVVSADTGHVTEHTYDQAEIRQAAVKIRQIAEAALVPWAPLVPGPEACHFCRALATCPPVVAAAARVREQAGQTADDLPPETVASMLAEAEVIGFWLNRVKARAHAILTAGGDVPGWQLREARGMRGWAADVTADRLREIGQLLGKDPAAVIVSELVSPAGLENEWGRAKRVREALQNLIVKKPGQMQLARTADGKKEEPDVKEG